MSQDSYDPEAYAELMAEKATYLRIDLMDGDLGRAGNAQREMVDQLIGHGVRESAAEGVVHDYVQHLRAIDAAAEKLVNALAATPDVTSAMMVSIRNVCPGFEFSHYAV